MPVEMDWGQWQADYVDKGGGIVFGRRPAVMTRRGSSTQLRLLGQPLLTLGSRFIGRRVAVLRGIIDECRPCSSAHIPIDGLRLTIGLALFRGSRLPHQIRHRTQAPTPSL